LDVLGMKLSELLAKITREVIYNQDFKNLARKSLVYFTRIRKLPFEDLMMYTLFRSKASIASSLRRFFTLTHKQVTMSQQSLS